MTVNERLECRYLVAEAKQKEAEDSSGEYLYRVRGTPGKMRIVQIKVTHHTLVKTVYKLQVLLIRDPSGKHVLGVTGLSGKMKIIIWQ